MDKSPIIISAQQPKANCLFLLQTIEDQKNSVVVQRAPEDIEKISQHVREHS